MLQLKAFCMRITFLELCHTSLRKCYLVECRTLWGEREWAVTNCLIASLPVVSKSKSSLPTQMHTHPQTPHYQQTPPSPPPQPPPPPSPTSTTTPLSHLYNHTLHPPSTITPTSPPPPQPNSQKRGKNSVLNPLSLNQVLCKRKFWIGNCCSHLPLTCILLRFSLFCIQSLREYSHILFYALVEKKTSNWRCKQIYVHL